MHREVDCCKTDTYYMDLALQEARKGLGRTSPNPCVGAVIVKDNIIISRGYHKKAGTHIIYKNGDPMEVTVPKYKLIMTHTARRSGATNMYKDGRKQNRRIEIELIK